MAPKVYKGKHTGELVFINCRTGFRAVRGLDISGRTRCSVTSCACVAEDVSFIAATDQETEAFWRATGSNRDEEWRA